MNANKALLILGIVGVAIVTYDEITGIVLDKTGVNLPPVWGATNPLAQYFAESWLAIGGAILILIAAFIPLG